MNGHLMIWWRGCRARRLVSRQRPIRCRPLGPTCVYWILDPWRSISWPCSLRRSGGLWVARLTSRASIITAGLFCSSQLSHSLIGRLQLTCLIESVSLSTKKKSLMRLSRFIFLRQLLSRAEAARFLLFLLQLGRWNEFYLKQQSFDYFWSEFHSFLVIRWFYTNLIAAHFI